MSNHWVRSPLTRVVTGWADADHHPHRRKGAPMPTPVQLPLRAAKVGLAVARERLSPMRVTDLDEVPPNAEALTSEWLTAALCDSVPGAQVIDFQLLGGSDGTSSRRALRVTYNDAGQRAGLPTRLFMKSAASLQSRLMLVLSNVT